MLTQNNRRAERMLTYSKQRKAKHCLTRKWVCAAVSVVLAAAWPMAAVSEEYFVDMPEEEALVSSSEEYISWEEDTWADDLSYDAEEEILTDDPDDAEDLLFPDDESFWDDEGIYDDSVYDEDVYDPEVYGQEGIVDLYTPEQAGDGMTEADAAGEENPEESDPENSGSAQEQETPDEAFCGECGLEEGTVFWELKEDGTLRIYGDGTMEDYAAPEEAPWSESADMILTLKIEEGVTGIGANAFGECSDLTSVRIG